MIHHSRVAVISRKKKSPPVIAFKVDSVAHIKSKSATGCDMWEGKWRANPLVNNGGGNRGLLLGEGTIWPLQSSSRVPISFPCRGCLRRQSAGACWCFPGWHGVRFVSALDWRMIRLPETGEWRTRVKSNWMVTDWWARARSGPADSRLQSDGYKTFSCPYVKSIILGSVLSESALWKQTALWGPPS